MLSELIFGKKLAEITLDDLKNFFLDEQEETSLLEFKSGGVIVDDLYKEVCAFLNTEGGVIIIGTPREGKKKPTPKTEVTICQGELTPSNFRGKDWLMTSIVSNISPSPTNLKIQEFHSVEGSYFIIEVPQSMTPPHQSNRDSRYYIRMEREAKPAPHGVVEALFFKRQKAKLRLNFNFVRLKGGHFHCKMTIGNISPYPTEKVSFTVQITNVHGITPHLAIGEVINYDSTITYNYTSNQVHWQGLFLNAPFDINHAEQPFYIVILAWSRDAELTAFSGIYDPMEMKFIESEDTSIKEKKGNEYYINRLKELREI